MFRSRGSRQILESKNFGSCDKRIASFTRHFLQHVAFAKRNVRYAVFKEQAPHPGQALAFVPLGCVASLREWCSLKAKQRAHESAAARVLSLGGPDGHRDATSFVFDLEGERLREQSSCRST